MKRTKRILTEPLVHFVLVGAALFVASALLAARDEAPPDAIVISAGRIDHLAALFERTWQRPPTRQELEGLVNDFIREELAYREGLVLGLDRDDTIIRRRLRQKLEFVAEDMMAQVEPTEDDLAAYLAEHPDAFRVDPRLTFRQVFLDPERRGDTLEGDVTDLLATLRGDDAADPRQLGDRILLEHAYADVGQREVAGLFGPAFADALVPLEPGTWHGPVRSAYGVHVVRVDDRTDGRLPELDEVRAVVHREWANERRIEAGDVFYDSLREKYEIRVEWP